MVTPTGKLIPIGGSENKDCAEKGDCSQSFYQTGVLKRLLTEMPGNNPRLEIVPTASGIPQTVTRRYIEAFNKLGCHDIGVIPVESREDALNDSYIDRIQKADGIFFTGGDQSRLSRFFGNTPFIQAVYQRYMHNNFVVAGTSAGAMAMSVEMITGSSVTDKDDVEMGRGLSLINNVIIDTHFVERGRYGRLARAVAANPGYIGIGLGEDAGLVVKDGSEIEVIGSGQVVIMDDKAMIHQRFKDYAPASAPSLESLPFHLLAMHDTYNLENSLYEILEAY